MGTAGWSHVFDLGPGGSFEAKFEYLPALPALRRGVAHYVGHFAQLLPGLPTHTKGNPPGPLVAMHLLGLTTPGRLAAACMIVGSLVTRSLQRGEPSAIGVAVIVVVSAVAGFTQGPRPSGSGSRTCRWRARRPRLRRSRVSAPGSSRWR
jgi:hypothetical protein